MIRARPVMFAKRTFHGVTIDVSFTSLNCFIVVTMDKSSEGIVPVHPVASLGPLLPPKLPKESSGSSPQKIKITVIVGHHLHTLGDSY